MTDRFDNLGKDKVKRLKRDVGKPKGKREGKRKTGQSVAPSLPDPLFR